jgi:4a-hydroxytetrahydrobiopterin dehydratase
MDPEELKRRVADLNGWQLEQESTSLFLRKEWSFETFKDAWGFLDHTARLAQELNHHPEIWNVYNKVRLRLTTHDAGNQVTDLDLKLASRIETLAKINF